MSGFFTRVRPSQGCIVAMLAFLCSQSVPAAAAHRADVPSALALATADLSGVVSDSASATPLPSVDVMVSHNGTLVATSSTDAFGRFVIHNLESGVYTVAVQVIGFRPATRQVILDKAGAGAELNFRLVPVVVSLAAIEVQGGSPLTLDTRTGDQAFRQDSYHGAPTNTTSRILQQSIAGAARAPTGEVHIRGQHAEYTYYVDGVPVPAGIAGSLNELFDPEVVNRIDFQTGGWDAEFGDKNAAIIAITTRIPPGGFHADASAYTGTFNTGGASLSVSDHWGPLGVLVSGARQWSGMRLDPVAGSPSTGAPLNFHNHGEDAFVFGKASLLASSTDVVNVDINWSRSRFAIPFDSAGGAWLDDHQTDANGFANLGWRHLFEPAGSGPGEGAPELFGAAFVRWGSLRYEPGAADIPQFVFHPDPTPYNLREHRRFTTVGMKWDYTVHPRHGITVKGGLLAQGTAGHEDFATMDAAGRPGPASHSGLQGGDMGAYAQAVLAPTEVVELRAGMRYDAHRAPFAGTATQFSPRVRLNYFPDPATTLYLYYGRQFMPASVEGLRAITSAAQGGVAAQPTRPERADFYEAGAVRRLGMAGLVAKLSAYRKEANPGTDDNTIPGSAITTAVNIARVHITGLEGVVEFHPTTALSGYVNTAVSHAVGRGPITGGFFPTALPTGAFDLDHDQRLSLVASATWSARQFYASATWDHGSGLTNGIEPGDCTSCAYGTGLFAANRGFKVASSSVLDASLGYAVLLNGVVLRPELFVSNVLDARYLLKGAFFSGASYGRPRSIQLRVHMGF